LPTPVICLIVAVMEIAVFMICLVIGGFFLWLAFLYVGREKYPTSTVAFLTAGFFFLCGIPWFQGFVKTWVISNVNAKLQTIGDQVNTVQKSTSDMQSRLDDHQKKIDGHQQELDEIQKDIRGQQSTNATQMQSILALTSAAQSAQSNLEEQEKKLEDVQFLVNNFFSKVEHEMIDGSDTNKVFIARDWGVDKQIALILRHAAIPNSIHGTFEGGHYLGQNALKAIGSSNSVLNLVFCNFHNPDLTNMIFDLEYVNDDRQTNLFNRTAAEFLLNGSRSGTNTESLPETNNRH
jgi:hypothetical protein